jgi:hypothetical protein
MWCRKVRAAFLLPSIFAAMELRRSAGVERNTDINHRFQPGLLAAAVA